MLPHNWTKPYISIKLFISNRYTVTKYQNKSYRYARSQPYRSSRAGSEILNIPFLLTGNANWLQESSHMRHVLFCHIILKSLKWGRLLLLLSYFHQVYSSLWPNRCSSAWRLQPHQNGCKRTLEISNYIIIIALHSRGPRPLTLSGWSIVWYWKPVPRLPPPPPTPRDVALFPLSDRWQQQHNPPLVSLIAALGDLWHYRSHPRTDNLLPLGQNKSPIFPFSGER